MATFLLLPYHGVGHFNPFFSIAKTLQGHGQNPVFAGSPFFHEYVSQQNFQYRVLKSLPFGMNFEKWINRVEGKQNLFFAEMRDRWSNKRYKVREKELHQLIHEVKPDVILLDAMQSTDFIVLYPLLNAYRIKIVVVHTMLPTIMTMARPALNSQVTPHQKLKIKVINGWVSLALKLRQWKQAIKFAGRNDKALIREKVKDNAVPEQFITRQPHLLSFSLTNINEIILAPEEFDFTHITSAHSRYVGFPSVFSPLTKTQQPYWESIDRILEAKATGNRKLIYCSFGTVVPGQKIRLINLLKRIIRNVLHLNHILVISLQVEIDVPAHPHLFVFRSANQVHLLKHVNVFITHGGLNSIRESIDAEVPMLVYPLHPEMDGRGNAARVSYHGLGIAANINDNDPAIQKDIMSLLGEASFTESIRKMKKFNQRYTTEYLLESLQAESSQ